MSMSRCCYCGRRHNWERLCRESMVLTWRSITQAVQEVFPGVVPGEPHSWLRGHESDLKPGEIRLHVHERSHWSHIQLLGQKRVNEGNMFSSPISLEQALKRSRSAFGAGPLVVDLCIHDSIWVMDLESSLEL